MAESAYAQPYRDEFAETCWRKLDEPGRVCILERGHDDGAHEPAADVSEQGHKALMDALARGELLPRDASAASDQRPMVFLVTESTWDHHAVLSAWAKREDADEEARRLKAEGGSYQYEVEEVELYV